LAYLESITAKFLRLPMGKYVVSRANLHSTLLA